MKYSPRRLEDDLYRIPSQRIPRLANSTRVIILSIFFFLPKPALVVVGMENISLFALMDYCSSSLLFLAASELA